MNAKLNSDEMTHFSISLMVIIALCFMAWQGLLRVDQYLKIKGIDDCAKVARYDTSIASGSATVSYPLQDVYKTCLRDKGIIK